MAMKSACSYIVLTYLVRHEKNIDARFPLSSRCLRWLVLSFSSLLSKLAHSLVIARLAMTGIEGKLHRQTLSKKSVICPSHAHCQIFGYVYFSASLRTWNLRLDHNSSTQKCLNFSAFLSHHCSMFIPQIRGGTQLFHPPTSSPYPESVTTHRTRCFGIPTDFLTAWASLVWKFWSRVPLNRVFWISRASIL